MGRIMSAVLVLVAVVVAAAFITDMPILRPVREMVANITAGVSQPAKSIENCHDCEAFCADLFEKCKETNCSAPGQKEGVGGCVEKCRDRYRACYMGCTGKYGTGECPPPSVNNAF